MCPAQGHNMVTPVGIEPRNSDALPLRHRKCHISNTYKDTDLQRVLTYLISSLHRLMRISFKTKYMYHRFTKYTSAKTLENITDVQNLRHGQLYIYQGNKSDQ